jgi:hypothetical protein
VEWLYDASMIESGAGSFAAPVACALHHIMEILRVQDPVKRSEPFLDEILHAGPQSSYISLVRLSAIVFCGARMSSFREAP